MTKTSSCPSTLTQEVPQHFVLEDASWELYARLLKEIGDQPLRVTYDQGRMEVMSPLPEHERAKRLIARMIDMLTFLRNMDMASFGSTTFRRREKAKGLEPDDCFYFRDEAKMRGRKRIDLKKDPPPELAVEIDVTHRSVPREPIYAALGVPELWRFDGARLQCLHLKGKVYLVRKMSLAFPFLEPSLLKQFIDMLDTCSETSILKAFVEWVRKNGWATD